MRQRELKKRYDPDLDAYVTKHIYGEGISNVFKSVGRKIFGITANKVAETAAKKAATATGEYAGKKAATATGEYAGKKAGDKIVELLSKNKTTTPSFPVISTPKESNELTDQEVNELTDQEVYDRVNRILSGGKLRRRNFI